MGCDIHFCIEKKVTEYDSEKGEHVPVEPVRWVGVYGTWETPALLSDRDKIPKVGEKADRLDIYNRTPVMKSRNYDFFAKLAGVRGEGPEPKGFPDDASELANMMTNPESGDDHSHSWDTLEDFAYKWILASRDEAIASSVADRLKGGDGLVGYVAGVVNDDIHLYRVVYWFDN